MACNFDYIIAELNVYNVYTFWIQGTLDPNGLCSSSGAGPSGTHWEIEGYPARVNGYLITVNFEDFPVTMYKVGDPHTSGIDIHPISYAILPLDYALDCGGASYHFVNSGLMSMGDPLLRPFIGVTRFIAGTRP